MNKYPNLFIIGAPKSGTTAMTEYLRTHPNVFMSEDKEPGFFSSETIQLKYPKYHTLEEYLGLFAGATSEQVIVGEASTSYIHSSTAIQSIRDFAPDARLVAMLRRPTDLVCSWHAELLKAGAESKWDMEKAWDLQAERTLGRAIPFSGYPPSYLKYKWVGSLGSQVQRTLEIFPRRQVHFILFEDFVRDTRTEYLRLLAFLGVPDDRRVHFPKMNASVQFKSRALARMLRHLRNIAGERVNTVKRVLGIRNLGIVKAFDRFNVEKRPRSPLRPEFRRFLDEVFRDEVLLLENLIGRDLSAWRN